MSRRLQQILAGWLLILAIGGHWPLLQSVAWVNMLVKFSQTDSLAAAVQKTFDGKHGCNLCELVKTGKEAEQKQAAQFPVTKLDLFLVHALPFSIAPAESHPIDSGYLRLLEGGAAPLSPPPKTLC